MGAWIKATAEDGHTFDAWRADPDRATRLGSIVVIQEIFGVNAHIRQVCDDFAALGYVAVAPALFDRVRRGVDLGYDEAGVTTGRALVGELGWNAPMLDVAAAAKAAVGDQGGKAGVVGYCWGGSIAWLAVCRLDVACASCYYGRQIIDFVAEVPRAPVILHFGAEDPLIPLTTVHAIQRAKPAVPVFIYENAGHGFNCAARPDFRPAAAALALTRTLALFTLHLR